MKVPPEFTSFTFPLIKRPAKKLLSEDLIMTQEERDSLWRGVREHAAEVMEKLKDCKCPKCVPVSDSNERD
jgi:hypothetical protein